jgi:spermidine synthase
MPTLKLIKTPYGNIRITRSSDGDVSYYQNGCYHSQADRNGVSACAYIHVIYELVLQSCARDVLIIGCAGGTLATMLQRMKCRITVVDINDMAFTIARDYFKLPTNVRCITKDGIAYLRTTQNTYDAIVIDVFGSRNTVPASFTTPAFFKLVKQTLSASGIMVMNFITKDNRDKRAEKVARHAQLSDMSIRLFDWPGQSDRNTLILGGGPAKLTIPSGREPEDVEDDMQGLVCRTLKNKVNSKQGKS